jgi:tetratricopeptide (TPR) repeat protein
VRGHGMHAAHHRDGYRSPPCRDTRRHLRGARSAVGGLDVDDQHLAGEQRTSVGRPVSDVREGEPGRSYSMALRKWPESIGMSRTELSSELGCSPSRISDLLNNKGPRAITATALTWATKIIKTCGGSDQDLENWATFHSEVIKYATGVIKQLPLPPEPGQEYGSPSAIPPRVSSTPGGRQLTLAERLSADQASAATPGALLRADVECVAFYDRGEDLDDLARWRDKPELFGIRLITGEGGQGKTRLALEFLHRSRDEERWTVEWVRPGANPHKPGDGVDERLRDGLVHGTEPVLVVVDDAESVPEFVSDVADAVLNRPGRRTRLLVVSRTVGAWWENLRDWPLLAGLTTHTRLGPLAASPDARRNGFDAAIKAMAEGLSTVSRRHGDLALWADIDWGTLAQTITVPDLRHERYGNVLTLHMAALTALLNAAEGESTDVADPTQDVLRHERNYLHRVAAQCGLNDPGVLSANPGHDSRIQESMRARDRAIAALILLGPCNRQTAESLAALACAGTNTNNAGYVADWLATVYPAPREHGKSLGHPQPDRLADAMLCLILDQQPDLLESTVPLLNDITRARHMLAVLARAGETPAGSADAALWLVELIRHHPTPFALVAPWVAATTTNEEQLLDGMCALADADAEQFNRHTQVAAGLVLNQLLPLAATGLSFLVKLYRRLLAVSPDSHYHQAGLASSLNGFGVMLAEIRRYPEALDSARQAVDVYSQLVDVHGETHRLDLVVAMATYALRLTETGQLDQAVIVSGHALDKCDQVAEREGVTYLRCRAIALNNYVTSLTMAGRPNDAVQPSGELIETRLKLVDIEGRDHLPQLAQAQVNHAVVLRTTGQLGLAVRVSEEAIETWRSLSPFDRPVDLRSKPDLVRFLPAMAEALATHAVFLTEDGRSNEALKFSQQALRLSEELVLQIGDAYHPTWAYAMQRHATVLSITGDTNRATSLSRRAVEILEVLTQTNRATYLPRLAQALVNHAALLDEASNHDDAIRVSNRLIELWQELAEQNHDRYNPVVGLAVYQHASRLAHAEIFDQAEQYAAWSVELFEQFADNNNYLLDYIQSLIQLGEIRVRSAKFQSAIEPLSTALTRSADLAEFDQTGITDLLHAAEQGHATDQP